MKTRATIAALAFVIAFSAIASEPTPNASDQQALESGAASAAPQRQPNQSERKDEGCTTKSTLVGASIGGLVAIFTGGIGILIAAVVTGAGTCTVNQFTKSS